MAKATALTAELMDAPPATPPAAVNPRSPVTSAEQRPLKAKTEKQEPLQIRIPASKAKAIKHAAIEADQTISEFMLACFDAYMKSS